MLEVIVIIAMIVYGLILEHINNQKQNQVWKYLVFLFYNFNIIIHIQSQAKNQPTIAPKRLHQTKHQLKVPPAYSAYIRQRARSVHSQAKNRKLRPVHSQAKNSKTGKNFSKNLTFRFKSVLYFFVYLYIINKSRCISMVLIRDGYKNDV